MLKIIRKVIRWIVKGFGILLLLIVVAFGGITLYLKTYRGNAFACAKIAEYGSKFLGTKLTLGHIDLLLPDGVLLRNVHLYDAKGNVLIHFKTARVNEIFYGLNSKNIFLGEIDVEGLEFNLRTYKGEKISNFESFLNVVDPPRDPHKPPSKGGDTRIGHLVVHNGYFKWDEDNLPINPNQTLDWDHIEANKINLDFTNINITKTILANINQLQLQELKSGFELKDVQAHVIYSDSLIDLSGLHLVSKNSDVGNRIRLEYKSINDMNDFIHKVKMDADFLNSKFGLKDLDYFAFHALKNNTDTVYIQSGTVKGTVAKLNLTKTDLQFGEFSHVKGDISFRGLPDINETIIQAKVTDVVSTRAEIMKIIPEASLPMELTQLGVVNGFGKFTGYINDFVADGNLTSDIGRAVTDVHMELGAKDAQNKYSGKINLIDFNLGQLLKNKEIGKITFSGDVDGAGFDPKTLHAKINAQIINALFNNYKYQDIKINGYYASESFIGKLISNDANIKLNFDGSVAAKSVPEFKGNLDILNLNLRALHFIEDTFTIASKLNFDFKGIYPDDLIGNINAYTTIMQAPDKLYAFDTLRIKSNIVNKNKRDFSLESEFLTAKINGNFTPSKLPDFFKTISEKYIDKSFLNLKGKTVNDESLTFSIDYDQIEPLLAMFHLPVHLPNTGFVKGEADTRDGKLKIMGFLPVLSFKDFKSENIYINANSYSGGINMDLNTGKFSKKDSVILDEITFKSTFDRKDLIFSLITADRDSAYRVNLKGDLSFSKEIAKLTLDSSILDLNNYRWSLKSKPITFYKLDSLIDFPLIYINNEEQILKISGQYLAKGPDAPIRVLAEDISIQKMQRFFPFLKDMSGKLNGNLLINNIKTKPIYEATAYISPLSYINDTLGILTFTTNFDQGSNKLTLETSLQDYITENEVLKGKGYVDLATNNLHFDFDLNKTPLGIIEPFTVGLASEFKGFATANLKVEGTLDYPDIAGNLTVKDGSFKFDYLGTFYKLNHSLSFANKKLTLQNLKLVDANDNSALVNGYVDLKNLSNPYMSIKLNTKNFQLLNTRQTDNSLYYGTAYGTGYVDLNGTPNNLNIYIKMKSDRGTVFNLPIGGTTSYSGHDFITFVDNTKKKSDQNDNLSGLNMQFDLAITPDAQMNIIFDPLVGDVMEGRGRGDLKMVINSDGDFTMNGAIGIEEGSYRFTIYDLLTKQFNIAKGGSVTWRGNPFEAELNVQALYKTRASIAPLLDNGTSTTTGTTNNSIVPVEAQLNLKGLLLHPEIKMDFDIPQDNKVTNSGTDLDSRVRQIKSDEQELNKQVVSLLVFNTFAPAFQGIGGGDAVGGGVNSSLGSLVTRQLSYFLSQVSENVSLGVDFKKGEGTTVNGSLNLLNGKVEVTGNYDANIARSATYNAQAAIKLNEDGSFRAKAHSRSNNNPTIQNENTNTVGVGVSYTKEFDGFNFFGLFKKKKNKNIIAPNQDKGIKK